MWIVRLALNRPYTFVVASMLIVILSVVAILRTPTDIFPNINIPVVSVVWNYAGLSPEEMERRIITTFERNMTTVVNDIEHIESQSYHGMGIVKVFFHPFARVEARIAQVTSVTQRASRQLPPRTGPPVI